MARKLSSYGGTIKKESSIKKKTSIGNGLHSKAMMNKSKRRNYKKYRGQGRP